MNKQTQWWLGLLTGAMLGSGIMVAANSVRAQQPANQVPCWPVPNGVNNTVQCANGYWITTTPEGETYTGNGTQDPSSTAIGSSIVIDPATGGPNLKPAQGPTVTPPTQQLPMLAPYQAQTYGFQPRQD